MQQNPEIIAIDFKLFTNRIFVDFVEKDSFEELPIFRRQLAEHALDQRFTLILNEFRLNAGLAAGNLIRFVGHLAERRSRRNPSSMTLLQTVFT